MRNQCERALRYPAVHATFAIHFDDGLPVNYATTFSPNRLMERFNSVFGSGFWPVPSQYSLSNICWLMVQFAYWFKFCLVPTWNQ